MRTFLETVDAEWAPALNPYFRWLEEPSVSREDFVETQVQFFFAVAYFSRPMALLTARLPSPEQRVVLLENIADEHGRGALAQSHEHTFRELLGRLGVSASAIEARPQWPEVRAFNHALTGACLADEPVAALAMLGMIERLFASASARLGEAIVRHGWLPQAQVVHYAVHQKLDLTHSAELLRPLETPWDTDAEAQEQIQQGLREGGHLLMRLYEDLYRHRARRLHRHAPVKAG